MSHGDVLWNGEEMKFPADQIMAQDLEFWYILGQDSEGLFLVLGAESKLLMVILANRYRGGKNLFARLIAAYQVSGQLNASDIEAIIKSPLLSVDKAFPQDPLISTQAHR